MATQRPTVNVSNADPVLEFCRLCETGHRPPLPEFLAAHPNLSSSELASIAMADMRHEWSAGRHPTSDDYFRLVPSLLSDPESALDVVYAEFLRHEERGERTSIASWRDRYPAFATELCRQIDFHRSLNELSSDVDGHNEIDVTIDGDNAKTPINDADTLANGTSRTEPLAKGARDDDSVNSRTPSIPGYDRLQEIGRGGMGVVYRARQISLGRDVALKFLYRSEFATPSQLSRFQAEAAAISRLRHPNFVQIYDYGTHKGCPFLVLEYVEGGTLANMISGVAQPLSFSTATIESLAMAIQYAHDHGVIHRDLKPNNVLVSAGGVLKITDLGLAKCTSLDAGPNEQGNTESGSLVGTPAYMAPEQVAETRDVLVTPAADVYSLGVTLYQLLTGTVPFNAHSLYELLRQIREQEPISPRDLRPDTSRDLETICLKCLHKEPRKRYKSAAELAIDLQRSRAGHPIAARRINAVERTWRWTRRNPLIAGLVASIFVLLTGGLSMMAALYLGVRHQAARADKNFHVAMHAVESYLTDVSDSPDLKSQGMEPLRRQLLATAQTFYEQLLKEQDDIGDATAKLAESHYRLARIHSELGDRMAAIRHYKSADDVYRRLAIMEPNQPDHEYWQSLCHFNLCTKFRELGDWRTAEFHALLARDIRQGLFDQHSNEIKYKIYLTHSLCDLVSLYAASAQPTLERESYDIATTSYNELLDVPSSNLSDDDELYQVHRQMGGVFWRRGMLAEAERSFQAARSQCQRLLKSFPQISKYQQMVASSNSYLAMISQQQGRTEDARRAYDDAEVPLEELTQRHPLVCDYRFQYAVHLMNRGGLEFEQEEWDQAESYWQRSRDLVVELQRDFPDVHEYTLTLSQLAINLGNVHYSRKEFELASDEYRQAKTIGLALSDLNPDDADVLEALAGAYHGLGTALQAMTAYDEALSNFHKSQSMRRQLATAFPDNPTYQSFLAGTFHNLAVVYEATDQVDLAERAYRDAGHITKQLHVQFPETVSFADTYAAGLLSLGNLLLNQRRIEDAILEYESARTVCERLVGQDPKSAPLQTRLGNIYFNLGRSWLRSADAVSALEWYEKATEQFRRASAQREDAELRENVQDSLLGCARSQYRIGHFEQALESCREAEQLDIDSTAERCMAFRAHCLAKQGKIAKALQLAEELRSNEELQTVARIDLAAAYAIAADHPTEPVAFVAAGHDVLMSYVMALLNEVPGNDLLAWDVSADVDFAALDVGEINNSTAGATSSE